MLNLTDRRRARTDPTPARGRRLGRLRPAPPLPHSEILVAEDQPVNQRVMTAMIEHLGFNVDVVSDGAEAVRAATEGPYRAILMDIQIPELNGYLATGEIRRLEGGSAHTPIIAMTASTTASDQQHCLAAGMDDYLTKPISLRALANVLAVWASDGPDLPGSTTPVVGSRVARIGPITADLDRPVLDAQIVDRLQRLGEAAGEDLMPQLATLFLVYADEGVAALHEALDGGDAPSVVRAAHTLHGSSANLGAADLARLCAGLEANGADGALAGGSEQLEAIEAELGRVRAALGELAPTP